MERTQWKLLSGANTIQVTSWNLHYGSYLMDTTFLCYLMELTSWKLPHGTYTMEVTSWNMEVT